MRSGTVRVVWNKPHDGNIRLLVGGNLARSLSGAQVYNVTTETRFEPGDVVRFEEDLSVCGVTSIRFKLDPYHRCEEEVRSDGSTLVANADDGPPALDYPGHHLRFSRRP